MDVSKLEILKEDKKLLRIIFEKLVTFGDLDSKYNYVDSSIGNIPCPFHPYEGLGQNLGSPAGKMYFDSIKDINVIRCFNKRRQYSAYDYCLKVQELDPYHYLINNKDINSILELLKALEKGLVEYDKKYFEKKVNYVNNLYEEVNCNAVDYIEKLYQIKEL